jgi:hypothetical protein
LTLNEGRRILKYSYRTGIQKIENKFVQLSLVFLLAVTGISGAAPLFSSHRVHALTPTINYTDVALTQSELDTNWSTDRTTPSGGFGSVTFDGQTAAELRVDNTHANTASTFYQTEGIQRQIPSSDALKANLYVDGSWQGKDVRAGLWGVAKNSTGDTSAYPIIEFTTAGDNGHVGWRAWDGVNGGWTNLPTTFSWNSWSTLEIVHNNGSTKFNVYINGQLAATNTGDDSTSLNAVILNSYNYATNNAADNYAAHWSNLGYGNVAGASVSSCATTSNVFTTDMSTWNRTDTRSAGHDQIVANGLHIWTDDNSSNAKVAGYYTTNFPLSGLGDQTIAESIDYQATLGTAPGLQLVTDFDNNGTPDGILVGEAVYGNNWWLNNGAAQFAKDNAPNTGGGNGSNWFGTPDEWLSSFPDAKVMAIGYSLGSGVHGDGIIKSITLGCSHYTFGFVPPVTPTNLRLEDHTGAPIACGGYTNFNYITPEWDAVAGAASYNYKVTLPNGSTYGPVSVGNVTSVSGPFGGVGTSTFTVQAVNAGGQTSDWATPCAITYDPTAPDTPTLLTPPNNSFVNTNDFYFTWSNTSDSGSPVKYEFQSSLSNHTTAGVLDSGVWNNIANGNASQNNLTTPQIHSTGAPDGTWYWQVRAIDAAGNKSAWSNIWNITIDTHAPVVAITAPHDGDTVHGTVTVSGTVTDVNPDHYYFVVKDAHGVVKAGPGTVNSAAVASWSWNTTNVADGVYTIDLEARDKANNKTTASVATIHVTVDNTGPVVSDNFTVNMGTGDKVTLNPTVTGDSNVSYLWSVSDPKLLNDPNANLTGSSLTIGPAPKGTYTVMLTVTDQWGNATTKTYAVTITPGNSNSLTVGRGGQPQTLGATTTASIQQTGMTGGGTTDPTNSSTGKVKGDSTTKPNTVYFANDSAAKALKKASSNFLGLGWWWLVVLAVLLGLFAFIFRRAGSNDSTSNR